MGCDFIYSGSLEDMDAQKKVIAFAKSYFEKSSVIDLNIEIDTSIYEDNKCQNRSQSSNFR